MTIQKANTIKFFRYLAIFCAITMGFFSIVATSEDDVKDALNITFDEDFDLTMDEITVDKGDPAPADAFEDCALGYSVAQALADLNNADVDSADIDSVSLNSLAYKYSNGTWPIAGGGTVTCTVSMTQVDRSGDPQDTTFADIEIDEENEAWTGLPSPTTENINVVGYYLTNKGEAFDICIVCDEVGGPTDDFAVAMQIKMNVNVRGEL